MFSILKVFRVSNFYFCSSNEPLTIRKYLDLHEHCLRLFNFSDPWKDQKAIENDFAISRLKDRLIEIDKLDADEKWIEIAKGMLAGMLKFREFL